MCLRIAVGVLLSSSASFANDEIGRRLELHEYIHVYRVREGNDQLLFSFVNEKSNANKSSFSPEQYDEPAFDSRGYYIVGRKISSSSGGLGADWVAVVDKLDEKVDLKRWLGGKFVFSEFCVIFHQATVGRRERLERSDEEHEKGAGRKE